MDPERDKVDLDAKAEDETEEENSKRAHRILVHLNNGLAALLFLPREESDPAMSNPRDIPTSMTEGVFPEESSSQNSTLGTKSNSFEKAQSIVAHSRSSKLKHEIKDYRLFVAEKKWNSKTKQYDFFQKETQGIEVVLKANARVTFSQRTKTTIQNQRTVADRLPSST